MQILKETQYAEIKAELVQGVDFSEDDVQEYMPKWFRGAMEVKDERLKEIGTLAGYPELTWRGYVTDGKCEVLYRKPIATE